jgi:O-antigen/teichoic acid export membrane protein
MKRKLLSDSVFSIIASVIPIFGLQFLILPLVASKISADTYGLLITLSALMNLSAGALGNILNNSKLVSFKRYEELKVKGDFNILLVLFLVISSLIMSAGVFFYQNSVDILSFLLLISASMFYLLKEYIGVEFKIKLRFKLVLVNSIILMVGYIIGFLLFLISGYWEFIFLSGFMSSFLFVIRKTSTLKESLTRTPFFKQTLGQTASFLISGILLAFGTYLDKLLLYPLLGGSAVAVYFTATIIGKTISMVIEPINNVLLSYLAQLKMFNSKYFYLLLGLSSIIGTGAYIIVILVSETLLSLLYPQYVDDAINYIYITTLSIIVIVMSNTLNTIVLKFCKARMQIIINVVYMIIYVCGSLILINSNGLMGFCIGILIASVARLIVVIAVYQLNIKNFERELRKDENVQN